MSTTQVSPPVALAVSMDDVAATLRMDADALEALGMTLDLTVRAITQEAEHKTQRSFITRQMRVTLDSFPAGGAIRLERGPVSAVTGLSYRDADGVTQQLDPQDFEVDNASVPGWLVPAMGKAWPATASRVNSVSVDYTAGYGETAAAVPECARTYILMKLAVQIEPPSGANASVSKPFNIDYLDRLLDSLTVYA